MSISVTVRKAAAYLGAKGEDAALYHRIEECLRVLEGIAHFRYLSGRYTRPLPFLLGEPYATYLKGTQAYYLCLATLGAEVSKYLLGLRATDMGAYVLADACASAYLETLCDQREAELGEPLGYRFCPGYGGSSVLDVGYIYEALEGQKAGIQLLGSGMMVPEKSMAGILAVGGRAEPRCEGCALYESCEKRRRGEPCWEKSC